MAKQKESKNNTVASVKWGESYTSLFLGAVVVVIIAILIVTFLKNNKPEGFTSSSSITSESEVSVPGTYTVKANDTLWSISEKVYGSGYNWVDIVKANNIENPDMLFVGVKLNIPSVKTIIVVGGQEKIESITTNSYKIETGDCLWNISVRAYGDGFKWTELAKVNQITNPDLIFAGNIIRIPR
jgi:nucleoid-associated protein YgaU